MAPNHVDHVEDPPSDREKKQDHGGTSPTYEDPFGDEEFAEVKYRTLRWWYALPPYTLPCIRGDREKPT
jgi:hypothetical protein